MDNTKLYTHELTVDDKNVQRVFVSSEFLALVNAYVGLHSKYTPLGGDVTEVDNLIPSCRSALVHNTRNLDLSGLGDLDNDYNDVVVSSVANKIFYHCNWFVLFPTDIGKRAATLAGQLQLDIDIDYQDLFISPHEIAGPGSVDRLDYMRQIIPEMMRAVQNLSNSVTYQNKVTFKLHSEEDSRWCAVAGDCCNFHVVEKLSGGIRTLYGNPQY